MDHEQLREVLSSGDLQLRLVTIKNSHFCEKARWALERQGLIFKEEPHVAALHMLFTRTLGGGTSVPKLVLNPKKGNSLLLKQSSDIVHFADLNSKDAACLLYPADEKQRSEVENLELQFDKVLGPHVRRWCYFHLLFSKQSYKLLTDGDPLWERCLAWLLMPIIRRLMSRGLTLTPEIAARSATMLDAVFEQVSGLLKDGRPYLCGDRFTAADLAFAALGGPLVLPDEYPVYMVALDDRPPEMAKRCRKWRETPAGQHILRMYKEERHSVAKAEVKGEQSK